jgi:hypothetical protein
VQYSLSIYKTSIFYDVWVKRQSAWQRGQDLLPATI